MKAYTNLEQSKKLAKILPVESADMYYPNRIDMEYQSALPIEFKLGNPLLSQEIPCWSLAVLLDILPETIEDEFAEYDLEIDMIYKKPKYARLGDCYHSDFPSWDWNNKELLDNIVEAVIWLNNNDYLRNEKLY